MKVAARIDRKIKEVKDELNRTKLFLDLLTAIRDSGFTLDALAKEAEVAPATLYFWVSNYTKHPRVDTVTKVATALGLDIRLYRVRAVKPTIEQRGFRVIKGK